MDTTRPFTGDTTRVEQTGGFGQGPNRGLYQQGRAFRLGQPANEDQLAIPVEDEGLSVDVSLEALITLLGGTLPASGEGIVNNAVPPLLVNPRAARAVAAYQARVKQARAVQVLPHDTDVYADTRALIKHLQDLVVTGATHLSVKRVTGQSLEQSIRHALSGV